MGANFAHDIADIAETELTMKQQITYHLRGNFYPPVPLSMVQPCIDAIQAYWEDETDRLIQLPTDGYTLDGEPFQILWRGQDKAPAWAICEQHKLDAWTWHYDYDDYADSLNGE